MRKKILVTKPKVRPSTLIELHLQKFLPALSLFGTFSFFSILVSPGGEDERKRKGNGRIRILIFELIFEEKKKIRSKTITKLKLKKKRRKSSLSCQELISLSNNVFLPC